MPLLQQSILSVGQSCPVCFHSRRSYFYLRDTRTNFGIFNRHRRIHETQADGQPHHETNLTDEDLENEENEFGSIEEGSPSEEQNYMPTSVVNMASITSMPASMPSSMSVHQTMPTTMVNPQMVTPQMIAPQMLQQHM